MKKVIILLILLVAFGNLLFADISFGAWGRTEFYLAQATENNTDIQQQWGPAWGSGGFGRMGVDFKFTSDYVDYTMNLRFGSGAFDSVPVMYVTAKLMPGMVSLLMGKFSGDGWDTFRKTSPHPYNDKNNGDVGRFNGSGIIVSVAPEGTGFEAGLMWAMPDDYNDGTVDANPFTSLLQDNAEMVDVAASYTVPDMVKITAGSTYTGVRNIFGRVELLMIPDLTLWADVKYQGLENATAKTINSVIAAGYSMDALTIAFASSFGTDMDAKTMTWAAYPEVYYNLGDFTLGIFLGVSGTDDISGDGITLNAQPYVLINNFNLRIWVDFTYYTVDDATNGAYAWAIPFSITYGF